MSDTRKTVATAILNVHSGVMSPEQAVRYVEDPTIGTGNPSVQWTSDEGERKEATVVEIVEDLSATRKALKDLGIDEDRQDTLFNIKVGANSKDTKILRDALQEVAEKDLENRASGGSSTVKPAPAKPADSEVATLPPKEESHSGHTLRLTTDSFFANFGIKSERYDVKKEFARGGMGRVLLARDKSVGRDVALKELLPELISGASLGGASVGFGGSAGPGSFPKDTSGSQGIVERFLREAKITGQLEHPNIVPVYEIGKDETGDFYYTMRFIKGKTLAERLRDIRRDESLDESERFAARIKLLDAFIDMCNAIAYAHSRGVIHRDIKPENIMLGDFGETLVLDWGLARVKGMRDRNLEDLKRGTIAMSQSLFNADSEALTMDGSVVGTPAYMAPEQARGDLDEVDDQSDVYALGAVLYQILTGYPPYEGPMAALIVQQVLSGPPLRPRARESQIPPELESLIERSMAREKGDRLSSALELASEVKAFRDGRTLGSYSYSTREMAVRFLKQNRTTVGIGVLCALLIVAFAVFSFQQVSDERDEATLSRIQADQSKVTAEIALEVADEQRAEKEQAEKDKIEAQRSAYMEKASAAPDLIQTYENMQIATALIQLDDRVADLDRRMSERANNGYMPLSVEEQKQNKRLLDRLTPYLSVKSRLLELFVTPAGVEPSSVLNELNQIALTDQILELRINMARLALYNANFDFASVVLSGPNAGDSRAANTMSEVSAYRVKALGFQSGRIAHLLTLVDDGLDNNFGTDEKPDVWGPIPAQVDEVVDELQLYQNLQALDILRQHVQPLVIKMKAKQALSRVEIDRIVIVARTLSNSHFHREAVALIESMLLPAAYPRIRDELVLALVATGSPYALETLLKIAHIHGRHFFDKYRSHYAELPLPTRLRTPVTAADYTDRVLIELAADRIEEAADAADRALNMDQTGIRPLLMKTEVQIASDKMGLALETARKAVANDSSSYNALILYADVLELQVSSRAAASYDKAIKLDPTRELAYIRKALSLVNRSNRWDSLAVLDEAVKNAYIPYRSYMIKGRLLAIAQIQRGNDQLGSGPVAAKKASEIDTGYFEPYALIAWQCRRGIGGGFGNGIAAGRHATTLNPSDNATYGQMAEMYYGCGDTRACEEAGLKNSDSSIATYFAAIAINQKIGSDDYLLWQAYWKVSTFAPVRYAQHRVFELGRAENLLLRSIEVNPKDIRVLWMLTSVQLSLRKFEEARKTLDKIFVEAPASNSPYLQGSLTILRIWHKSLQHLELLDVDLETGVDETTSTQRQRMQKIQLLATCTEDIGKNASIRILLNTDVEDRLREALRLIELVRVQFDALEPKDQLEFFYTEELLISALTARTHYTFSDAYIKVTKARVDHGKNVTDGAIADLIHAYLSQAANYQIGLGVNLGSNNDEKYEFRKKLWALTDQQRLEKCREFVELAYEAYELAINLGAKPGISRWMSGVMVAHSSKERYDEMVARAGTGAGLQEGESLIETPMVAWGVTEKHPAWVAGLREGDVIQNIDGRTFTGGVAAGAYIAKLTPNDKVSIKVRRYTTKDGEFVPLTDDFGAPVTDELGRVQLEYEEFTFNMRGGYMGFFATDGVVPLWTK